MAQSGGGGISLTGGGTLGRKKTKRMSAPIAAQEFLMSQGMSAEEAQAEVTRIKSQKGETLADIPGFKKYLRSNADKYGLKIRDGKIIGTRQTYGGSFESSTDPIKEAGTDLNLDLMSVLGGALPEELQSSLAFQNKMRDYIGGVMGTDFNTLTQQDEADVAAQYAAGRQRAQTGLRDNMRNIIGSLTGMGVMESSFMPDIIKERAADTFGDQLVNLEAQQAAQRQGILNARSGRRNAAISSAIGAAGGLGFRGVPFVNPQQYGGFTDPQAFAAGQRQKEFDVGLQVDKTKTGADIMTRPVVEEYGGGLGDIMVDPLGILG
jgi:hypothetical protein